MKNKYKELLKSVENILDSYDTNVVNVREILQELVNCGEITAQEVEMLRKAMMQARLRLDDALDLIRLKYLRYSTEDLFDNINTALRGMRGSLIHDVYYRIIREGWYLVTIKTQKYEYNIYHTELLSNDDFNHFLTLKDKVIQNIKYDNADGILRIIYDNDAIDIDITIHNVGVTALL